MNPNKLDKVSTIFTSFAYKSFFTNPPDITQRNHSIDIIIIIIRGAWKKYGYVI